MMTWTVKFDGRDGKEGFAVVTAENVQLAVMRMRDALEEAGLRQELRNDQFIPMVTGTRKVRILKGV